MGSFLSLIVFGGLIGNFISFQNIDCSQDVFELDKNYKKWVLFRDYLLLFGFGITIDAIMRSQSVG